MPEIIADAAGAIPEVLLRTLLSIVTLFLLAKLSGARQISQLNFYDYIVGITVGSIAATLALDVDVPILHPIIALLIYLAFMLLSTLACKKSIHLRRFLSGTPLILIDKGRFAEDNLKKSGMDLNEFLSACRSQGYFDVGEIAYAIMETTGRVSILPKAEYAPLTPQDVALAPPLAALYANVILDGKVMRRHLRSIGKDDVWLQKQLFARGYKARQVLLAVADAAGHFEAYPKNAEKPGEYFM